MFCECGLSPLCDVLFEALHCDLMFDFMVVGSTMGSVTQYPLINVIQ